MLDKYKGGGEVPDLNLKKWKRIFTIYGGVESHKYKIVNEHNDEPIYIIKNEFNDYITLEGNLRKFWYGSISAAQDLNYKNFVLCVNYIAELLKVHPKHIWHLRTRNVELGLNLKMKPYHLKIIPAMKSYPRLKPLNYKDETTLFRGAKRSIIGYNKLKEVLSSKGLSISKKNKNKIMKAVGIFRFELRHPFPASSKVKNEIRTLQDIRKNWNLLLDHISNEFGKIEIQDDNGNLKTIEEKSLHYTNVKDILAYLTMRDRSLNFAYAFINKYAKTKKASEYRKKILKLYRDHNRENKIYLKLEVEQAMTNKILRLYK